MFHHPSYSLTKILTLTHQNNQESHQALIPIEMKVFKNVFGEEKDVKTTMRNKATKQWRKKHTQD